MIIETKFKEGDSIWSIHNSKAFNTIVRGIKIERTQLIDSTEVKQDILYLCSTDSSSMVYIKINETLAYSSKEYLLRSL